VLRDRRRTRAFGHRPGPSTTATTPSTSRGGMGGQFLRRFDQGLSGARAPSGLDQDVCSGGFRRSRSFLESAGTKSSAHGCKHMQPLGFDDCPSFVRPGCRGLDESGDAESRTRFFSQARRGAALAFSEFCRTRVFLPARGIRLTMVGRGSCFRSLHQLPHSFGSRFAPQREFRRRARLGRGVVRGHHALCGTPRALPPGARARSGGWAAVSGPAAVEIVPRTDRSRGGPRFCRRCRLSARGPEHRDRLPGAACQTEKGTAP
jgi:hypothetical protein